LANFGTRLGHQKLDKLGRRRQQVQPFPRMNGHLAVIECAHAALTRLLVRWLKVINELKARRRQRYAGHVSLGQLKVMSAIEDCRTAALGGHVVRCENAACGYTALAYNSCRNRHCPKCQGAAAREWLGEREAVCSRLRPRP
jgi:hypothetical protein